jgi:hypothetical protein
MPRFGFIRHAHHSSQTTRTKSSLSITSGSWSAGPMTRPRRCFRSCLPVFSIDIRTFASLHIIMVRLSRFWLRASVPVGRHWSQSGCQCRQKFPSLTSNTFGISTAIRRRPGSRQKRLNWRSISLVLNGCCSGRMRRLILKTAKYSFQRHCARSMPWLFRQRQEPPYFQGMPGGF